MRRLTHSFFYNLLQFQFQGRVSKKRFSYLDIWFETSFPWTWKGYLKTRWRSFDAFATLKFTVISQRSSSKITAFLIIDLFTLHLKSKKYGDLQIDVKNGTFFLQNLNIIPFPELFLTHWLNKINRLHLFFHILESLSNLNNEGESFVGANLFKILRFDAVICLRRSCFIIDYSPKSQPNQYFKVIKVNFRMISRHLWERIKQLWNHKHEMKIRHIKLMKNTRISRIKFVNFFG
jgi:hypothetical protein